MAPMIEARTISSRPDRNATVAMISSGRLPKVALRSPPTAEPVRVAMCSVPCTIRRAAGTMARAAAKNTRAGDARSEWSRRMLTGTKRSSQLGDGLSRMTAPLVAPATARRAFRRAPR